jgi:hypothetical protein
MKVFILKKVFMINFNTEYFKKPYYFFLKDKGDKMSLYYSVSENLNEAKQIDSRMDFDKSEEKNIKTFISVILSEGKKMSTGEITGRLKKYKDGITKEFKETKLLIKIILSSAKNYIKDKDFELSKEEKDFIKDQSGDIAKLIPLIVLQLLPGSTLATPFIIEFGKKLGIKMNSKIPEKYKEKEIEGEGELAEFVDADGTLLGSNIPMLDQQMHPHKTLDQTVKMARANQWPYYKRYWGESIENNIKNLLDEVDQSESFGFEETEDVSTYDEADEIFKDELGVEDDMEREERVKRLGFDRNLDKQLKNEKKRGMCRNCFTKRRLSELEKEKMTDLIDEILVKKKKKSNDVVPKDDSEDSPVIKILIRNIESIKKIADKEGISINKLIKHLKEGE